MPLRINPQPKQNIPRDKKYLKWIESLGCIECGAPAPSNAHHSETGGTGIKGSDYSAIPLCTPCHNHWHNVLGKKGGIGNEVLADFTSRLLRLYYRNSCESN